MNCKGKCKQHGKPCLASVDPEVLEHTRKAAAGCGMRLPEVKSGVMQHTHRCRECLGIK